MLSMLSRCRPASITSRRRLLSRKIGAKFSQDTNTSQAGVRPFEEIPEVKGTSVPLESNSPAHISELWRKRHDEYGDIYREKVDGVHEWVFCRSIRDTEELFRKEGRYPNRPYLEGVGEMRDVINMPESITNLRGEDWYKMRRPLNELLMKNKMIWKYATVMQEIAEDFADCIERRRDYNGEVPDFSTLMNKWAFENSGSFIFNTRLDMLRDEVTPATAGMFNGMGMLLDFVGERMFSPQAKMSKQLEKQLIIIRDELRRLFDENSTVAENKESVLGGILSYKGLSQEDKASLIMDILFSAFETTARATELALYCVTLEPDVQESLRKEVMSMPAIPTGRELDNMEYTNAFLKEVNRLYPFTHIMARIFDHDITLSGFRIPSGTIITNTINVTQNKNPDIFCDPDKFTPERWLDRENHITKFSTTGPFGFGARSCPGRRLAMQEIHILLRAILKRFRVEYNHEPIISVFKLTGATSEEPKLAFHSL